MKGAVIYDSKYGNAENIATIIANRLTIPAIEAAKIRRVPEDIELLIVGSPTQGGRPAEAVQEFLALISKQSIKSVRVAAFDTSFDPKNKNVFLRLLMRVIGYAAPKIAKSLKNAGGKIVARPEHFIVADTEGPLVSGEEERAKRWASEIERSVTTRMVG